MSAEQPGEIVGISESAQKLRQFVKDAARADDPVTLTGEPGTGKQLAARLIHEASARSQAPFLMIDCSLYYEHELQRELFGHSSARDEKSPRKGLLEFALRGTCYLSRVEELSPMLQRSLLDFLRAGCFARLGDGKEISSEARLIVSSDKNLQGFVEAGLFDSELYAKLSCLKAHFLPLRERKDDIPVMVESLVQNFAAVHSRLDRTLFSPEVLEAFQAYPWPSNVDGLSKEVLRCLESGLPVIRCENLAMDIAGYWLGHRGDPEIRNAIEELDALIREFKVLSRIEAGLGEMVPASWVSQVKEADTDLLEDF